MICTLNHSYRIIEQSLGFWPPLLSSRTEPCLAYTMADSVVGVTVPKLSRNPQPSRGCDRAGGRARGRACPSAGCRGTFPLRAGFGLFTTEALFIQDGHEIQTIGLHANFYWILYDRFKL